MQREDRAARAEAAGTGLRSLAAVQSPRPQVSALGYISGRGSGAMKDPELKQQAELIAGFCAGRGWQLLTVVADHDPRNRRQQQRPSLAYAIERLRSREASALVVAELKRLCPTVADLGVVLDLLEEANARLISLDPPVDSSNSSGRMALRVMRAVSGWERARRAEMMSAARARAAASQAIEPKLKRQIQRMRGAGMTLQAIADALNEEGLPTVRGGSHWRPSSVQAALGYKRPSLWREVGSTDE
jgi:DNA invertase Pin-like site-specific DNA recombinase